MDFMVGLIYLITGATYVGIGIVVHGWIKHGRKKETM